MLSKITPAIVSALGLAQLAIAQGNNPIPIPVVTDSGSNGGADCGGCYAVADVAGIAFGTETVNAVVTQGVIVQQGRNGTYTTTTSIVQPLGKFTIGPSGLASPGNAGSGATAYNTDSTLILSGVTLTSPTAYNVFTAYSLTSNVFTNGACVVSAGSSINLPTAYSVPIPQGVNPVDYAQAAQQSFVSFIGAPQCSLAGIDYAGTTAIPLSLSTTQVTTTNTARATPQPVSIATTAATTTGPTATFIPLSGFNASRVTYLPGGTGVFTVSPVGATIIPAGASRNSALGAMFGAIVAFVAGVVA